MSENQKAARAAEKIERTRQGVQNLSENPEMAKGTIGAVVLDMIRTGEELSRAMIIVALEGVASGQKERPGVAPVLAKGALKVISDLQPPAK